MLRPLLVAIEFNQRLYAVEEQVKQTIAREELRRVLAGVLDLERLLSRITLETVNPRDLVALAASLARIPVVRSALAPLSSERLQSLHVAMDELNDVRTRIEQTIIPEPPISLNEGGVVQPGADCELDELRELSRNGKQFLAQMEQRERERTGISSLKVRFNSVFGYYLEVSKANLQLVPPDYERRQTLVNAERFSTPELKQYEAKILLLTGPNMGGKSTYLRQTALIVIMAQMGCFVPASKARLGIVDRVFTRIGASDNLARGRSTFMVEMTETAAILNTATSKSLILLDEVGRGTATYDGLAIAWAAIEYLDTRIRAKTLFATHYFELTELADRLSGVKNYHVSVKETGGGIVFLRKVEAGAADRSYGIEVAKLAGLPHDVVVRAREVLEEHENAEQRLTDQLANDELQPRRPAQLTIFTPLSHQVVDRLREVDLNGLTPLEALNLLAELKKQIE